MVSTFQLAGRLKGKGMGMLLLLGILPNVYPLARTQSHGHTKMQQENLEKAVFVAVSQLISGKHIEDKDGK